MEKKKRVELGGMLRCFCSLTASRTHHSYDPAAAAPLEQAAGSAPGARWSLPRFAGCGWEHPPPRLPCCRLVAAALSGRHKDLKPNTLYIEITSQFHVIHGILRQQLPINKIRMHFEYYWPAQWKTRKYFFKYWRKKKLDFSHARARTLPRRLNGRRADRRKDKCSNIFSLSSNEEWEVPACWVMSGNQAYQIHFILKGCALIPAGYSCWKRSKRQKSIFNIYGHYLTTILHYWTSKIFLPGYPTGWYDSP